MARFLVVILVMVAAGCSSSRQIVVSPESMTVEVPDAIAEEYSDSPLSRDDWLYRQADQSVPVFRIDTSMDVVRATLLEWNVLVIDEWPGYIVVRENAGNFHGSGEKRIPYIYGFDDERLTLGPLTFGQLRVELASDGLDIDDLDLLRRIVANDESTAENLNDLAWLLATLPESELRNPTEAIELALDALSLTDFSDWSFVDTLAAALAADGRYEDAASAQRDAVSMRREEDPEMRARLNLYEKRSAYTEIPAGAPGWQPPPDNVDVKPRADIYLAAVDGSSDAQYELAAFYLENDIAETEEIDNPGVYWMNRAALGGNANAANEMGYCLLHGQCGVPIDAPAALQWFRVAAQLGEPLGSYNAGYMLAEGVGVSYADREATERLIQAADSGMAAAAFRVAFRLAEGVGEEQDAVRAGWYLQLALAKGYSSADFVLDDHLFIYFVGGGPIATVLERQGLRPDETAGALLGMAGAFEKASLSAGETISVTLADDTAYKIPKRLGPEIVFGLTRLAASLGSQVAQRKLAGIYANGPVDYRSTEKARYWHKRAARQAGIVRTLENDERGLAVGIE